MKKAEMKLLPNKSQYERLRHIATICWGESCSLRQDDGVNITMQSFISLRKILRAFFKLFILYFLILFRRLILLKRDFFPLGPPVMEDLNRDRASKHEPNFRCDQFLLCLRSLACGDLFLIISEKLSSGGGSQP